MHARTTKKKRALDADPEGGFTMIEVLAVVFLLALAASLVVVNFGRNDDRATANQLAIATAIEARQVRSQAIRLGQDQVLLIDLERRRIAGVSGGSPVTVGERVDLNVEVSANERRSSSLAGIRFFANGMSTGGTIRFGTKGKAYEVRVNWFTGRVGVAPVG